MNRNHLCKEHVMRSYMWEVDRNGKSTNKPIDAFNHCIDPMRYLAMAKLTKKSEKVARGVTRRN